MSLQITKENEEKALRCIIDNSVLNSMGFYESKGGSPQEYLRKIFPDASPQEIYALLQAMVSHGILTDCDMGFSQFRYDSKFLDQIRENKRESHNRNVKDIIGILIAIAAAISGWLAYLFKP